MKRKFTFPFILAFGLLATLAPMGTPDSFAQSPITRRDPMRDILRVAEGMTQLNSGSWLRLPDRCRAPGHASDPVSAWNTTPPERFCSWILDETPHPSLLQGTSGFPANTEWWPVCSLYDVWDIEADQPRQDRASALSQYAKSYQRLDECGGPKRDPLTQLSAQARPMSRAEIAAAEQLIHSQTAQLREHCCGSNEKCLKEYDRISTVWCAPKTGRKTEDDCLLAARYDPSERKIYLAPYVDLMNQHRQHTPMVTAHELGHACSHALRLTSAKSVAPNGLPVSMYERAPGFEKSRPDCRVTNEMVVLYSRLFSYFGANEETIHCLLDTARGATKMRFKNEVCPTGCPNSYLEESFANLMALFLSFGRMDIDQLNQQLCRSVRDDWHALPRDDLKCFLKSPLLKKRMIQAMGCST